MKKLEKENIKNILAGIGAVSILLAVLLLFNNLVFTNNGDQPALSLGGSGSKIQSGSDVGLPPTGGSDISNPPIDDTSAGATAESPTSTECVARRFSFTGDYSGPVLSFKNTKITDTKSGWSFEIVGTTVVATDGRGVKRTLGSELETKNPVTTPSGIYFDSTNHIIYIRNGPKVLKFELLCGKITIIKKVKDGLSKQDFPFIGSFPAFSLKDDGLSGADGTPHNKKVFYIDNDGTKVFTESPIPTGWRLDSLSCTVDNPISSKYTKTTNYPDSTKGPAVSVNLIIPDSVTCTYTNACSGASWKEKAGVGKSAPGGEMFANIYGSGFSIGGKIYFGGGFDDNLNATKAFYEYDPNNGPYGTWRKMADMPLVNGYGVASAATFSIGDKGYVVGGFGLKKWINDNSSAANFSNPVRWVFEFDPSAGPDGVWTRLQDFPGTPRGAAVGFTIGDKGYMGTGHTISNNYGKVLKDFWEYAPPPVDSWTQKADMGASFTPGRAWAVGFAIGNNSGYVGTGRSAVLLGKIVGYYTDFWQFTPGGGVGGGKWTQKADFGGGGMAYGYGFALGTKGYIGGGPSQSGKGQGLWEYDSIKNIWTWKADLDANTGSGFSLDTNGDGIDDAGYLITRQDYLLPNQKGGIANKLFQWKGCSQ